MSKKTHTVPLSRREVGELRKNPYIASVTAATVRFTEEFKKLAYGKKRQGIPVTETMRQCGIDPEVLGASRVEGFSYTLNRKAKQENELAHTRQEVEFLKKLQAANMEAQKQWGSRHRQK